MMDIDKIREVYQCVKTLRDTGRWSVEQRNIVAGIVGEKYPNISVTTVSTHSLYNAANEILVDELMRIHSEV